MSNAVIAKGNFTCDVCYDAQSGSYLSCPNGHAYDLTCARSWAKENPDKFSCPTCRKTIDASIVLKNKEIGAARKKYKEEHATANFFAGQRAADELQAEEYTEISFPNETQNDEAIARALSEENKTNYTAWAINSALFAAGFAFVAWSDSLKRQN